MTELVGAACQLQKRHKRFPLIWKREHTGAATTNKVTNTCRGTSRGDHISMIKQDGVHGGRPMIFDIHCASASAHFLSDQVQKDHNVKPAHHRQKSLPLALCSRMWGYWGLWGGGSHKSSSRDLAALTRGSLPLCLYPLPPILSTENIFFGGSLKTAAGRAHRTPSVALWGQCPHLS